LPVVCSFFVLDCSLLRYKQRIYAHVGITVPQSFSPCKIKETAWTSAGGADDEANLVGLPRSGVWLCWCEAAMTPIRSATEDAKIYRSRGKLLNSMGLGSGGVGWKASSWLVKSSAKGRRRMSAVKMWTMNCETNFRGKDFRRREGDLGFHIDIIYWIL
jgi:hypothetical protein